MDGVISTSTAALCNTVAKEHPGAGAGGTAARAWMKGSPLSGSGMTMCFSAGTHSP